MKYKAWKEAVEEDKLNTAKQSMKVQCKCSNKVSFYAFEHIDKKVCDWCGNLVFKDKKAEYNHRMKQLLIKSKKEN